MDKRKILRLDIKFGKFLDPILIVLLIFIFTITTLTVINLSPRDHSEKNQKVLGVLSDTSPLNIKPVYGEHKYITEENLEQISPNQFKYTTFIKKNIKPRISKPIIQINNPKHTQIKAYLTHTNTANSKISIVESKTSYILKNQEKTYSQSIDIKEDQTIIYLLIENPYPILFNQYIEIQFFTRK